MGLDDAAHRLYKARWSNNCVPTSVNDSPQFNGTDGTEKRSMEEKVKAALRNKGDKGG